MKKVISILLVGMTILLFTGAYILSVIPRSYRGDDEAIAERKAREAFFFLPY